MVTASAAEEAPTGAATRGRRIMRNAAYMAGGQAILWSLSLLFLLVVPRKVGPTGWGEWSIAWALNYIAASIAGAGISVWLLKEMARDLKRTEAYLGSGLAAQVLLAVPLVLVVAALTVGAGYRPHTQILIAVVTATGVVTFISGPIIAALQALEKMEYTTLGNIVSKAVVSIVAVALVLWSAPGVIGISIVSLGGASVAVLLQAFWLRRYVRVTIRFDWRLIRQLVLGGLPFWATGLFLNIYVWIDALMLSVLTTTTVVGWYGAAAQVIATLGFLPSIVVTVVFPALSHSFRHDAPQMRELARRSFGFLTSLSLPISVGLALVASPLVTALFGHAYANAGPVLAVLSLTLVPVYIATLVNGFLSAADRQGSWMVVMGILCVVNPLLNLVAIGLYQHAYANGALGAAMALLVTDTLSGIAAILLLPPQLRQAVHSTLPAILRSALATALMAVVVWLLNGQFVLLQIGAGLVVFGGAALAFRVFPAEDLAFLRGAFPRIFGRFRTRIIPGTHVTVGEGPPMEVISE